MFSHGRAYSDEVMLSPVNDYKGVPIHGRAGHLWPIMRVKAEQATTYLCSWLRPLSKVNTFHTLPESLTLALSTSGPLLSSKPSAAE